MGTASPSVVDRLRQPEYTGENRCMPCTYTNVGIALVVSAGLWLFWEPLAPAFLVVALAAIYLRGYLVPGTPELTKRYFPDRVLRWFDKDPVGTEAPVAGSEADFDPEPVLLDAGAVEFCMDGEDLCATEEFETDWRREVERLREEGDLEARLADLLGADPGEVAVEERDSFCLVRRGEQSVARWESKAALLADLAAIPGLDDRYAGWDDLDVRQKGRLLNGARVFLERCPSCDGEVTFSQDTRESCCRSVDVVALECADCESLLLEVEA